MLALGPPQLGLHSLRDAHASALVAAGVDQLTISRRLGHATPAFTLAVYGQLLAPTDAAAARAIDIALAPNREGRSVPVPILVRIRRLYRLSDMLSY